MVAQYIHVTASVIHIHIDSTMDHKELNSFEVAANIAFQVLSMHPDHNCCSLQHSFVDDEAADDDSLFNCNGNDDDVELDFGIFVVGDCSMSQDSRRHHHLIRGDDDDVFGDDCCYDMVNCFSSSEAAAGMPSCVVGTITRNVHSAVAIGIIDCQSFVVAVSELADQWLKYYQATFAMVEHRQMALHLA